MLRRKIAMAAQLWLVSAAISGLHLNDGDLIFQTSRSSQSAAIQRAAGSSWSHMCMIANPPVATLIVQRYGYGTAVPLDEPVISPVAMFASRRLEQVLRSECSSFETVNRSSWLTGRGI